MPLRDDTVEVATFRRTDYRAPGFAIEAIDLVFDLDPVLTTVSTRFSVKRVPQARDTVFRLDGEDLEFDEAVRGVVPACASSMSKAWCCGRRVTRSRSESSIGSGRPPIRR
jgi:hypothetical protein